MKDENKIEIAGIVCGLAAYTYANKKNKPFLPYFLISSFLGRMAAKKVIENQKTKKSNQ